MRLITSSAEALINRIWRNPPSVYEVTDPRTHMIKRITKIVQSIFELLPARERTAPDSLSAQIVSPLFLVGFWASGSVLTELQGWLKAPYGFPVIIIIGMSGEVTYVRQSHPFEAG